MTTHDLSDMLDKEARRERIVKQISHVMVFLLIFFSIIGIYSLATGRVNLWKGTKDTLDIALGKPGQPYALPGTLDFSDMDRTLKGIEHQLERMNDIQLKIHQEGR